MYNPTTDIVRSYLQSRRADIAAAMEPVIRERLDQLIDINELVALLLPSDEHLQELVEQVIMDLLLPF